MADNTSTEAAKGGATGRIVRIVGAVVDVEFPADAMPAIYNALTVKAQTPSGEVSTVLEVQTHLPGDIVRTRRYDVHRRHGARPGRPPTLALPS